MLASQKHCRNILLRSLRDEDFQLLDRRFDRVSLHEGDVVAAAGKAIDTVCFLDAGVASYSEISKDGTRTGIGMVGYEGLIEWHTLLGSDVSPHEVNIAVGGGGAFRISAADLLDACRRSASLNDLLMRFVRSFMVQLGRTVVSNLCDPVERRLCRWLLMNHDRLEGDEIELTHNQIGTMLGVRRASVTDALHILEGEGLIRCERRRILVRDRRRLRECAGENYGSAEAEYSRLIGPFGKDT